MEDNLTGTRHFHWSKSGFPTYLDVHSAGLRYPTGLVSGPGPDTGPRTYAQRLAFAQVLPCYSTYIQWGR